MDFVREKRVNFCNVMLVSFVLRLLRWHLEVILPLEDQFRIWAFDPQVFQCLASVAQRCSRLSPSVDAAAADAAAAALANCF